MELKDYFSKEIKTPDTTDSLKLYYSECSRYRLLKPEEEKNLIKEYQEKNDPDAFDILVGANQGLVQNIIAKYKNRGLDDLELINAGNIGLMEAIKTFDLSQGNKLSTYAWRLISQSITKALCEMSKSIKIPTLTNQKLIKMHRIEDELTKVLYRKPSDEEIVIRWNQILEEKEEEMTINELEQLKTCEEIASNTDYLNSVVKRMKRADLSLYDVVANENAIDPILYGEKIDLKIRINKAIDETKFYKLEKSNKRARLIIRLRYGIFNDEVIYFLNKKGIDTTPRPMTFKKVGELLDTKTQCIQQTERKVKSILYEVLKEDEGYQKRIGKKKDNH